MKPEQELIATTDAARAYGVSRQAVEQAIARSLSPPRVAAVVGKSHQRLFDRAEFHAWWTRRTVDAWAEHRPRAMVPTRQINIRVPLADVDRLLTLRKPGQSLANLTAQVFAIGLEAALEDGAAGG